MVSLHDAQYPVKYNYEHAILNVATIVKYQFEELLLNRSQAFFFLADLV